MKNIIKNNNNHIKIAIFNAIYMIVIFIAILYLLFNYIYMIKDVEENSMQPLLNPRGVNTDIVYVNRFDLDVTYGDVVILEGEESIVKRVLGLPGDTIDIKYNEAESKYMLYRNDICIYEDYIKIDATKVDTDGMYQAHINFTEFKTNYRDKLTLVDGKYLYILGENEIFLLGDNRRISLDSSSHGAYDIRNISGTVEYIQGENESNIGIMFDYIFRLHWIKTIIDIFN